MENLMNIIGEQVEHRTFGRGIIDSIEGDYFNVVFNSDINRTKRKFEFPNTFLDDQKYLSSDSPSVNKLIALEKNSNSCSRCGEYSKTLSQVSEKRLCQGCLTVLVKCIDCGCVVEPSQCRKNWYGEYICNICYQKYHFICSHCGKERHLAELVKSPFLDSSLLICECCAEENYCRCYECDVWMPNEFAKYADGSTFCSECFNERTFVCEKCGQIKRRGGLTEQSVCFICESKASYLEYASTIDFSKITLLSTTLDNFFHGKTELFVSRLKHCYGEDPEDSNKKPVDMLLLDLIFGTLVVVWSLPEKYKFLGGSGTRILSDIKRVGLNHLFSNDRFEVAKTIPITDSSIFYIWEVPYKFGAQTATDKSYGGWDPSGWYGRLTDFFILGYLKKQ